MTTPMRPPTSPYTPTEQQGILLEGKIAQQKALQKEFDAINAASRKLGGKPSRQKALLHQKALAIQAKLKALNAEIPKLQQSYWQASGQYDKLLQGTERDAFLAINTLFKSYGLESLAGKIFDFVKNGYSADTISILLQDTKEYKERFAGNEQRKAKGLPVLDPSSYLALESAYKQIMASAGLPQGFYDQPSDFNDWIGKDIAPKEIEQRVEWAIQANTLSNPQYRAALKALGISDGEMVAYWLDENKALPILTKTVATAAIGAEALRAGLKFDKQYAGELALEGITADQARQGYSQIGAELEALSGLGSIYGESYTQRDAEQAILQGKGEAIKKRGRLASQERAAFGGATGGARGGLGQRGGAR